MYILSGFQYEFTSLVPPADSYVLSFVNSTDLHTVASSDTTLTASQTSAIPIGIFTVYISCISGDIGNLVREYTIQVYPNPTTTRGDFRSHSVKMLQAIEEVLEYRAGRAEKVISQEAKSIEYLDFESLMRVRREYEAEVRREELGRRGKSISIRTTFQ